MEQNVSEVEVEPTFEEVEQLAAKQLLTELTNIKNKVYSSNTLINSMLIVQLKMLIRGLISKYNSYGFFLGETITLELSSHSARANFRFEFSPKLRAYINAAKEQGLKGQE